MLHVWPRLAGACRQRLKLPADDIPDEDDRDVNQALRAERNRHVGHRDDRRGEFVQVFAVVGEREAEGATAVGVTSVRRDAPSLAEVANVKGAVSRLLVVVERQYEAEVATLRQ